MKHIKEFELNENNNWKNSFKKEILDAYIWIRKNNQSIPDDVLDFMKNAALEKLQKEEPPVRISNEERNDFIDYMWEKYGPDGTWPNFFKGLKLTKEIIKKEFQNFIKQLSKDGIEWGGGDSVDSEFFRDYLLNKLKYKS